MRERWRTAAAVVGVACLSGLVALVVANLVAVSRLTPRGPNPIVARFGPAVYEAYPGWSRGDVDQLLNECWTRSNLVYDPYVQFKERPRTGRYVNVSRHGFRVSVPQGPWPPDPAAYNVFVFGGSRVFGYGVPDDGTIPSLLQARLAPVLEPRPLHVYNFGRGFYFLGQERVLFERLLSDAHVPDLAVFVDGGNDLSVYRRTGAPRLTREVRRLVEQAIDPPWFQVRMPLLVWLERRRAVAAEGSSQPALTDTQAIAYYLRSRRLARAAADAEGVRALFVWHPVATYGYDRSLHPLADRLDHRHDGYAEMARYVAGHPMGDDFLWLADIQQDVHVNLYADREHYNVEGCRLVAGHIADALVDRGYLAGGGRGPTPQ